jgi:hypothetical protein
MAQQGYCAIYSFTFFAGSFRNRGPSPSFGLSFLWHLCVAPVLPARCLVLEAFGNWQAARRILL